MDLDEVESSLSKMRQSVGYEAGFEAGKEAGSNEGAQRGAEEGKRVASIVGFYNGFARAWLAIVQQLQTTTSEHSQVSMQNSDKNRDHYCKHYHHLANARTMQTSKSNKIKHVLNDIVEMTQNFPKINKTECEDKLLRIDAKFKQLNSMLNLKMDTMYY